ncbi:MAG: hypothetical protein V1779_04935 [bacterium]
MLDRRKEKGKGRREKGEGRKVTLLKNQLRIGVLVFIVALLFLGCATTKAPRGWLESPSDVDFKAWGGWVQLKVLPDKAKSIEDFDDNFSNYDLNVGGGEFISFQDSLVYVIFKNKVLKIPFYRIYRAELEISSDKKGWLALWTVLGTLSTASHGFVLIFTAPAWLLFGTAATVGESNRNRFRQYTPDYDWWVRAKKFSRFPQGLPKDFDLSQLKSKMVE